MVGKRINNLPSVSDYTDEDYLIVEQESGTRKGTFKQVTDTIVKKLSEDDTLSSNLITSSGAISALGNANGKPMSGSFYVDNGYKLIAPAYDNANNRIENTESAYPATLIDVHYNYQSNYTAARYPNFWTIGNTDLDLNIYAKDNTYISSNVKCAGNVDVSGGTLKLNCATNGANSITGVDFYANQFNFLSNVKNGKMNEIRLGDANAKLNVYSMEEPTFYDSSKMQTYKFLTEGNITNTRLNGIWLNEAGGAIYGGTNTGSDGSSIVPLYKILEVANNGNITLGSSQFNTLNINCKATLFGKEIVTKDQLSNLPGGSSSIITVSGDDAHIALGEDAYISTTANDGAGTILQYKSGVLHVGASSKELQLDCTLARVNSGMILTQYNYGAYINSDVTYVAGTYNPGGTALTSDSYIANNCLTKSTDFSGDAFTFKPPVAGIYEISMSTSSGKTSSGSVEYSVGSNAYSASKVISATVGTTGDTRYQLSGKVIIKCASTSDTTHILEVNPSTAAVTIVIKLLKRL